MYKLLRNIFFRFDAENVHHWVMKRLMFAYKIPLLRKWLKSRFTVNNQALVRTVWGIDFPNPVGLAGGFDKNAEFIDPLSCLGFGFIEIGTVTPLAQPGNPKPRLFRLPADKALLNRMGFNNEGVEYAVKQLKKRKEKVIIAGNIGKNKITPNSIAIDDYEKCFNELYDYVDLFVVNISSPNTPGLRELQDKEPLTKLLFRLMQLNAEKENHLNELYKYNIKKGKPILLKIAPDLTNEQLDDIIEIVQNVGLHGIVATNTTVSRYGLTSPGDKIQKYGAGGISGLPVKGRATEVVSYIHKHSNGKIPIVACGGIFKAQDAIDKLNAGATLVQIYTGFIYEGPQIVKNICTGLLKCR